MTFQRGNIFFALFGAVAFMGVLGTATMTFMKGPLKTSSTLSRMSVAETQMQIGAQMTVLQASSKADLGDCDSDGFVEPMEFKVNATASQKPVGGGNISNSLGATKRDPWGMLYGYCVWNNGTNPTVGSAAACDDDASATEDRLDGSPNNYDTVFAIVSAGPDRIFATTCQSFDAADVDNNNVLGDVGDGEMVAKTGGSDDLILSYTYAEAATAGGGGLWSIKSSDPGTAIIDKAVEFSGGLSMGTDTAVTVCNASTDNMMRYNTTTDLIEVCDGAGTWVPSGGSSSTDSFDNDNSIPCDGTILGQVRYNTTLFIPEFCDGTDWRSFTIASDTANLVLTPVQQGGMNVDGTDNKDPALCTNGWVCGDEFTFILQNQGETDSASITTTLIDTTYFALISDTCNGVILTPMESCDIIIRPRANGNMTYNTGLQITADNNPSSILQGEATLFACASGVEGAGGIYIACDQNDGDGQLYDLVLLPGGCDGSTTNPTCSGTDGNAVRKVWSSNNTGSLDLSNLGICFSTNTSCSPAQQHQNIMALSTIGADSFPAVEYCDALIYNGKTDWFLPSKDIFLTHIQSGVSAGVLTRFVNSQYWQSWPNYTSSSGWLVYYPTYPFSSVGWNYPNNNLYTRCVRREGVALPSALADTDPDNVSFARSISFTSGGTMISNTITITDILQTITVDITGGVNPAIIHNGINVGTSVSGVRWGDTIALQMDGPTVLGTQNTATINLGDDVRTWKIGYADSSITAKAFVTSITYGVPFGGLTGADAKCNTLAAASSLGLSPKWIAMLSSSTTNLADRIPWNWGTLEDVTGTVIADGGMADLFDGSIDNPFNKDEFGNILSYGQVWTASNSSGEVEDPTATCGDWSIYVNTKVRKGALGATNQDWISRADQQYGYCANGASQNFFCFEDIDAPSDTTPNPLNIDYEVQVATSTRTSSTAVLVSGMSATATQTLSVSATGGTPTFTINGGSEITSGSVENGDSLVFYMTSSATDNSFEKMTITAGGLTDYWRVWTGDSTGIVVKRVFVTSTGYYGSNSAPPSSDINCQTRADAATLGGTWKAIISGITESNYAINRIGYNWSELQRTDGTTIVYAPNLWETDTIPLLAPIIKTEFNVNRTATNVFTNTQANGSAASIIPDGSNCWNWTSNSSSFWGNRGDSSQTTSSWLNKNIWATCYWTSNPIYCIEQ